MLWEEAILGARILVTDCHLSHSHPRNKGTTFVVGVKCSHLFISASLWPAWLMSRKKFINEMQCTILFMYIYMSLVLIVKFCLGKYSIKEENLGWLFFVSAPSFELTPSLWTRGHNVFDENLF